MSTKKNSVEKITKEKTKSKSTVKNDAVKADSISKTMPTPLPVESNTTDSKKIMANISVILGIMPLCSMIMSVVFPLLFFLSFCSFFFSIGAIVLGILGRESQEKIGIATVGIILGVLGIILPLCFLGSLMVLSFIKNLI